MNEIDLKQVLLITLDSTMGFHTFDQIVDLVGKFQNHGINASGNPAPGAPLDGAGSFQIFVPEDQLSEAQEQLKIFLT